MVPGAGQLQTMTIEILKINLSAFIYIYWSQESFYGGDAGEGSSGSFQNGNSLAFRTEMKSRSTSRREEVTSARRGFMIKECN